MSTVFTLLKPFVCYVLIFSVMMITNNNPTHGSVWCTLSTSPFPNLIKNNSLEILNCIMACKSGMVMAEYDDHDKKAEMNEPLFHTPLNGNNNFLQFPIPLEHWKQSVSRFW